METCKKWGFRPGTIFPIQGGQFPVSSASSIIFLMPRIGVAKSQCHAWPNSDVGQFSLKCNETVTISYAYSELQACDIGAAESPVVGARNKMRP